MSSQTEQNSIYIWQRHILRIVRLPFMLIVLSMNAGITNAEDSGQINRESISKYPGAKEAYPREMWKPPSLANQPNPMFISQEEQSRRETYQYTCDNPKERADADSCQQRRSADAAEQGLKLNHQQLWVGVIGAAVSGLALLATAWAAYATSLAARSAERSAQISEQSMRQTQRAYVTIQEIKYDVIPAAPKGASGCRIDVYWKNSGPSPAMNVIHAVNAGAFTSEDGPWSVEFRQTYAPSEPHTILAGASFHSNPRLFSQQHLIAASKSKADLYIWGWLEYDDVFIESKRHRIQFCDRIIVYGKPEFGEILLQFTLAGGYNKLYDLDNV
ncbi:hypothetical protein ACFQE0_13785 [Methylobacterium komagatae]|uniref:Uncharacterized protein n=1 Tax=Methylobacterium komagatae TaxID=374425 RepID=A0ABW2BK54_9HYPH